MQQADASTRPDGQRECSAQRWRALLVLALLPIAFAAFAEEPKEKRVIRNVTPDSIPVIVLPPRNAEKPVPQEPDLPDAKIRTTVEADGTVHAGGRRLVLTGVTPLQSATLCESPTHGRWACGVRAYVALRALVHGKELRCNTSGEIPDGAIGRCYSGTTDVSHWLLREGLALYNPAAPDPMLAAAADDAKKHGRGLWQNNSQPLTAIP
ncbi:MAG TPA: thermonuclease family protein [Xanthobacteraceae bacterium]|nr:thermonuclease family protein [Xanthobacteraceae bacterium]